MPSARRRASKSNLVQTNDGFWLRARTRARTRDFERVRGERAPTDGRRRDASIGGVFDVARGRVVVVVGVGGGFGDAEGNGADVVFEWELATRLDDDGDDGDEWISMRATAGVVDERVDECRGEGDDDADVARADGRVERGARGEGLEQV